MRRATKKVALFFLLLDVEVFANLVLGRNLTRKKA